MGQRGPAPEPPELRALKGGRGHRPINLDQTFRPEVGLPDAPRWLLKEGRKAWRRLSVELIHYNLLSKVDRDAFALLCQTIGRIELMERALSAKIDVATQRAVANGAAPGDIAIAAADALTASTPNGMLIQSVQYQVLNKEQAKLSGYLAEFGLTPAQRARVTTAIRRQVQLFSVEGSPADPAAAAAPAGGFAGFPD
jgi:P27 family predicted phage terminase small subunit